MLRSWATAVAGDGIVHDPIEINGIGTIREDIETMAERVTKAYPSMR